MGGNQASSLNKEPSAFKQDRISYPNGDEYVGGIQNGKRFGKGFYTAKNGSTYDGEWLFDQKHGKGVYKYKVTGEYYDGEWVNNNKQGFGKYFYQNGSRYTGQWMKNLKHGHGTLERADFSGWTGPWQENEKNGKGTAFDSHGNQYVEIYQMNHLVFRETPAIQKKGNTTAETFDIGEESKLLSIYNFCEKVVQHMGGDNSNPNNWSEDDCCKFIEHIGMGIYKDLFRKGGISGLSLLKITEKDLIELGIKAKGHRIKLRESIKKLRELTKQKLREKIQKGNTSKSYGFRTPQMCLSQSKMSRSIEQKLRSYYDNIDIVEEVDIIDECDLEKEEQSIIRQKSKKIMAENELNNDNYSSSNLTPVKSRTLQKNLISSPMIEEQIKLPKPFFEIVPSAKRRSYSHHFGNLAVQVDQKIKDDNVHFKNKLAQIHEKEIELEIFEEQSLKESDINFEDSGRLEQNNQIRSDDQSIQAQPSSTTPSVSPFFLQLVRALLQAVLGVLAMKQSSKRGYRMEEEAVLKQLRSIYKKLKRLVTCVQNSTSNQQHTVLGIKEIIQTRKCLQKFTKGQAKDIQGTTKQLSKNPAEFTTPTTEIQSGLWAYSQTHSTSLPSQNI